MDLSIVFGTHNRRKHMFDCIKSIRHSVGPLSYEIIVADGGSTDGSREWLAAQPDVVLLGEHHLDGAIRAYNKAFSLAQGWAVAHLNDDAVCIGYVLENAHRHLWAHQDHIGQIAFAFDRQHNGRFYPGDTIKGHLTANLGMTQALLGHAVGWWGQDDVTYGGDNRLSLEIWKLGYKVVSLGQVHHVEVHDDLREANAGHAGTDSRNFFARLGDDEIVVPPQPLSRKKLANTPIIRPW